MKNTIIGIIVIIVVAYLSGAVYFLLKYVAPRMIEENKTEESKVVVPVENFCLTHECKG